MGDIGGSDILVALNSEGHDGTGFYRPKDALEV
jgi:hypothetical protein